MSFQFRCPACDELFISQRNLAGAEFVCLYCETKFEIQHLSHALEKGQASACGDRRPGDSPLTHVSNRSSAMESPISFQRKASVISDDLDMTPMVDVTFLLLIFFMITASFSLQKSFEVPTPKDNRPSSAATQLEDLEGDPKYVIVRIDDFNTFQISAAAWNEQVEAPSKQDLLEKLRESRSSGVVVPTNMLVLASEECRHEKVIDALDAGTAVGMEEVKLVTMPAGEE